MNEPGHEPLLGPATPPDASGIPEADAKGELFFGRSTLHSYDLVSGTQNTCGHAAIAALWDFYNRNPYNLPRTEPGPDGRMHFHKDSLVGRILHQYPPTALLPNPFDGWKPISAVVRETLIRAFQNQELKTDEGYPPAYSDGAVARRWLTDWLKKNRLPVITLVDLKTLGENDHDMIAHWGLVFAVSDQHVRMASWGMVRTYPWEQFMRAWKMPYLPYPNNFYQLRVWA